MAGLWTGISRPGLQLYGAVITTSARLLATMAAERKGLLLGLYECEKEATPDLTPACEQFQSTHAAQLKDLVKLSGLADKKGKCRIFYGLDTEYTSVAVVSLGKKGVGYNEQEELDETRENIRSAVAAGIKKLQEEGVMDIHVDPCGDAEAAAEAATLCTSVYDELKTKKKPSPQLSCFIDSDKSSWERGVILGEGQNLARYLMESPANHMTPTRFSEIAVDKLGNLDKCEVRVRDKAWAESMNMGSFLSVSKGSDEPLKFVEIEYKGGKKDEPPFAIIGKGITFDSGGISLKPSAKMDEMRADMGGGACALSSIYTAARLRLPINIMGFIPLCENMPNGKANKPGDVVTAMNGKTIQIDNTDAEGRLILCDALCYAQTFKPSGIIDMATLTGAIGVALGAAASGVFTNSADMWTAMHKAGAHSGDRVWRMPLFKYYTDLVKVSPLADLNNSTINTAPRKAGSCTAAAFLQAGIQTGDRVWRMPLYNLYTTQVTEGDTADLANVGSAGREGGSCTAAAFLREFVTHERWMHIDIAGVMMNKAEVSYLPKGMSGRPTRTIVEFLKYLCKQ